MPTIPAIGSSKAAGGLGAAGTGCANTGPLVAVCRVRPAGARLGAVWGKRAELVVHERDPFNAEPPGAALAGELFTGVDLFYARNHGPIPGLDRAGWQLTVDGLVDMPLRAVPR